MTAAGPPIVAAPAAPSDGKYYVQKDGVWVEWVYGTEYAGVPVPVTTPLVGTAAFQTYVDWTTPVLIGGLYELHYILISNGTKQSDIVEVQIVIDTVGGISVREGIGVDLGDDLFYTKEPRFFTPGTHRIETTFRHVSGPGVLTATFGATTIKRVA